MRELVFIAVEIDDVRPDGHTEILVGKDTVAVRSSELQSAGRTYLHLKTHGEVDGVSEYDARIATLALFAGEEEFGL